MLWKILFGVVVLGIVGAFAYVRLQPLDVARLHVDPETAPRPAVPGHVLVRDGGDIAPPVFEMSRADLAARLEAVILATPRTDKLTGDLAGEGASYVTRSALWGFPDIASVKIIEVEGGVAPIILSRLRYGHADLGVNRARAEAWLNQL